VVCPFQSFLRLIIICKWSKLLDFLGWLWYKKGESKEGEKMKEKVLGCDVSKDYIILHDGSQAYKLSLENFKSL
jgi:hypothetical protein